MGDQLARAEEFERKAEKKLNSWGLFGSKYEDAADLFDKAANSFKLAKSCNYIHIFSPDYYFENYKYMKVCGSFLLMIELHFMLLIFLLIVLT